VAPLLSSYKKGTRVILGLGRFYTQVTPVALLWHPGSVRENALHY